MAWDSDKKQTPYFVSTVATGIYRDEFDSDTGYQSISQISGWLENNVGLLNTQIYTAFSGSGKCSMTELDMNKSTESFFSGSAMASP